jgi:tRNA(Ile)-lysidine synthase
MTMTPDGFSAAFRRHFPDLLGQPVLVALSGGADSVALLCLLHGSSEELGCRVSAAHVHHHLRGAPADGDAAFCAELCRRLEIPLVVEHLDPVRPRGSSPEAWWRQERYRVLEGARRVARCAALATAHTRDDQAETVLLKLLRGAGPRGVAGVRRRHGAVVRPLLDFGREELRAWLSAQGVTWREDASNADPEQPRAWIRSRVLPLLAGAYPHGVAHLTEFATALAEDDAFIGGLLRERGVWPEVGRAVPAESVAALPPPLLRRWVLELAARLPLAEPPSRGQLAAVLNMLGGGPPAAVDLGRRWVLRRRGGSLVLSPPPIRPYAVHPAAVPSRVELPGGFVATLGAAGSSRVHHRAVLHPRAAALPLAWRPAAPGERFGTSGKPVARALARAGIPAEWRRAWPALEAGGTMIWLPAVGVAQGWEGGDADGVVAGLEEPWGRHVR